MSIAFYIHYEGEPGDFTLKVKWKAEDAGRNVGDLLDSFAAAYNAKNGDGLVASNGLQLLASPDALRAIDRRYLVSEVVQHKMDTFAVRRPGAEHEPPVVAAATCTGKEAAPAADVSAETADKTAKAKKASNPAAAAAASHSSQPGVLPAPGLKRSAAPTSLMSVPEAATATATSSSSSSSSAAASSASPSSLNPAVRTMVARLLSNAFSYVQVGNYKKASELWEQIVSLDALNPFAHTGLAGVAHQNKKHGPAASHYKRALAGLDAGAIIGPAADEGSGGGGGGQAGGFHPGDPHLGQSLDQRRLSLAHSLGDCLHSSGKFKQAIDVFHDALDFVEPGSGGDKRKTDLVLPGRAAAIGNGQPQPASSARASMDTSLPPGHKSSSSFPPDKATAAAALSVAKSLLHVKMGTSFYAQDGAAEKDAGITLLQAVLKEQGEEYPPALVAYAVCLAERGHEQEALRVYLRLLVKDSGNKGIQESLSDLVQKHGVAMLDGEFKKDANCAPALAFLATLIKDHGAVDECVSLYETACDYAPQSASYCLNLMHSLEVCFRYRDAIDVFRRFCRHNPASSVRGSKLSSKTGLAAAAAQSGRGGVTCSDMLALLDGESVVALDIASLSKEETETFTADELDLFAAFFTVAKVLYVLGDLHLINAICEHCEPLRKSGKDLHLTNIRNEHAYFCFIHQVMGFHAESPSVKANTPMPRENILYLAADSHSLAPGWSSINVHGVRRTIQPCLVTGLKCWHMREGTKFFPKFNLRNVVHDAIPDGSQVIFMFGEIDCREGILLAVEKCRYVDLEEGIAVTVDIYVKTLLRYIEEKKFTIFVHPIAPVLNETRYIVKVFNRILKDKVLATPQLNYLDLFPKLLSPDGNSLHADFALDGTHLSPKYVPLIEEAMNKLPARLVEGCVPTGGAEPPARYGGVKQSAAAAAGGKKQKKKKKTGAVSDDLD